MLRSRCPRCARFTLLTLGVGTLLSGAGRQPAPAGASLYEQFRDAPAGQGLSPYWYWNGRLTARETRRQIRSMIEQGVRSAVAFPWDGMEVPYLSEPWWQALGDALEAAAEHGFTLNLNDDFTWPSGHAWDHYQQGAELSRVLKQAPQYRMRSLVAEEISVRGPAAWRRRFAEPPAAAVAVRGKPAIGLTQQDLRPIPTGGTDLSWDVPDGEWTLLVYAAKAVVGAHNTRVDLLNPAAVRRYIEIFYDELARRFPRHLGATIRITTADHEGTYGVNPVATAGFWPRFAAVHGYDGLPLLPLLRYGTDARAAKFRWDYFALVSEMYRDAFVRQITEWCERRGIRHTASFYEEQLAIQVKNAGDMFALWRASSIVEIDALLERARMPIDFKEAVSVAHFERKPLAVENQGLQGHSSFLSPEKMRLGTNMALLWGANLLIPYFDYEPRKVQWPPQWFEGQPFWRFFRHYADYVRRATWLNSAGAHVAPIAIFYPLDTAWASGRHIFDPKHRNELQWGNAMDGVQAYYSSLQLELARDGWDYHIVDSHYLETAGLEAGHLRIADERFRAVILPPLTTMRRAAAARLQAFFDAGGVVIAVGRLPTSSPESGGDDPDVEAAMRHIFGPLEHGRTATRRSAAGGAAYFFPAGNHPNFMNVLNYLQRTTVPAAYQEALRPVLEALARHVSREMEVRVGDRTDLYASRRRVADRDVYWIVNDTASPRRFTARLNGTGAAERWDPLTGNRTLLRSREVERRLEVDLELDPWDATIVAVGGDGAGAAPQREFQTTETIDLNGGAWSFTPHAPRVLVPYAQVRDESPADWRDEWLAPEAQAQRSWWMIGPFAYGDHTGYNEVFPPERELNLAAEYAGEGGALVKWSYQTSPTYSVDLRALLKIPSPANSVAYAFSYLHAPARTPANVRIAFADSAKVWWNGKQVFAAHRHPKWMLLRDPAADSVPVTVEKGWNRVLLKITRSENRPISFLFRLTDREGRTLRDVVYARAPDIVQPATGTASRWYRVFIPPGTSGVVAPRCRDLRSASVGAQRLAPQPGATIDIDARTIGQQVAFECGPADRLEDPIAFVSGTTPLAPGSWTNTPLQHYSGVASYETRFDAPPTLHDRVVLDLGQVGVAASVTLNGRDLGARVWSPFVFDVTDAVRPGQNVLRVTIANSDAPWQAQGDPIYPFGSWGMRIRSERERLAAVRPNGLEGPVTIRLQRAR